MNTKVYLKKKYKIFLKIIKFKFLLLHFKQNNLRQIKIYLKNLFIGYSVSLKKRRFLSFEIDKNLYKFWFCGSEKYFL
jgi:hypothetical protein